MPVWEALEQVKDKESFLFFLKRLSEDFAENPDEWQNGTIESYLECIAAWLKSDDDKELAHTDYKEMAKLFYAGKIYE